ncbi:MAG: dTMP kinase [Candidatus Gygaella obscura]|nr:dTMP kinase [Candidatus Gygaella obscura]
MAKKDLKGIFITFEGSEGSGKSTQSKMLCSFLKSSGLDCIIVREPGSTKISEKIRDILLDCENKKMSKVTEMLLYMAARAQIVEELILAALKKGKVVICDRFLDSTIAYQGYGLGIDIILIKKIGSLVSLGLKPDLTFLLDLPLKQGLKNCHRVKNSKDRIEKRNLAYHLRVRNGYLKLAKQSSNRIKLVKVEKSVSKTQESIQHYISALLKRKSYAGKK